MQLWLHPPPAQAVPNQAPRQDRYFARPLLLWMPLRLWGVQIRCPHADCPGRQGGASGTTLTRAGVYPRVRRVLDLRGYYHLAAETLECPRCRRKVISWSRAVVDQLQPRLAALFRVILTYRCGFDLDVVRLLRDRGLGNSPSRLYRQLLEAHGEEWQTAVHAYLSSVVAFAASGLHLPPLPAQQRVPTYKSLLKAYVLDALSRVHLSKALITSVFGEVLKMDSRKKVRHDALVLLWRQSVHT